MPKLLVSPKKKKQAEPACGRTIAYNVPTSPWQKLIDGTRHAAGLSYRELSDLVIQHLPPNEVGKTGLRSTIWIWTHSKNGYPHPKSFSPAKAAALYKVLKVDPTEAAKLLDASRHLYTPREELAPAKTHDALSTLVEILKNSPQQRISIARMLNLVLAVQRGLPVPDLGAAPAPVPPGPKGKKSSEHRKQAAPDQLEDLREEVKATKTRRELLAWARHRAEKKKK